MTRRRPAVYFSLAILVLGISACARRKAQARFPVEQYQALVREGDQFFEKGHLWGWREADRRYEKAWEMAKSDELLERRVVCLTLEATRERDELIPNSAARRKLEQLEPVTTAKLRLLMALAAAYRQPKPALPADLSSVSFASLLDTENSPPEAYLYLLCLKTFEAERHQEAEVALEERYKDSNIFCYSAPAEEAEIDQLIEREPEFAELRFFSGHSSFQKMELAKAREQFEKTIELLPDYAEAVNSLGDVFLFGFRDNAKALEQYEAALSIDPDNIKALFGKGVVLHYLGQYAESDRFLDTLLAEKQGWDYLSATQTQYYRGQGYYYKAYNAYLSSNFAEARKHIDTARTYVPNFGGIYYLSGLLYYRLREMEPARSDFLRALEQGREYCDAPYYLGAIEGSRDGESTAAYFLACGDCYRNTLREERKRVEGIPKMDITEPEKQILKSRIERDIVELGQSAGKILDDILRILPGLQFEAKVLETQLLTEVRQELHAAAENRQP
jgi:tetratricopeptide (TPR) repeat protein